MMLERKTDDKLLSKYDLTVDMPKCFGSMRWSKSEKKVLKHLGRFAFKTLFPEYLDSPQCFLMKL